MRTIRGDQISQQRARFLRCREWEGATVTQDLQIAEQANFYSHIAILLIKESRILAAGVDEVKSSADRRTSRVGNFELRDGGRIPSSGVFEFSLRPSIQSCLL